MMMKIRKLTEYLKFVIMNLVHNFMRTMRKRLTLKVKGLLIFLKILEEELLVNSRL
jgi:hypothetical protein